MVGQRSMVVIHSRFIIWLLGFRIRIRIVTGPCPRRPSSRFHAYTLSRLRRGLEPLPSPAGATSLGVALEIVRGQTMFVVGVGCVSRLRIPRRKLVRAKSSWLKYLHVSARWIGVVKNGALWSEPREPRTRRELLSDRSRKATDGVSTDGVTAHFMFCYRGTFWVLRLPYFSRPKSARAYLVPQFCFGAAPIVQ